LPRAIRHGIDGSWVHIFETSHALSPAHLSRETSAG
jgi:hypothetical protein